MEEVIGILAPCTQPTPILDPRVVRARELLRSAPIHRLTLGDLAAAVSLSPSRLAHLLRAHLGLPVRRYLLWLRLRDALREIAGGATITCAAHAAGFADAPHLDRTFRRMLGFTPSAALRVSRFVQDGIPPCV
jgi:AraC-like DNA-binding protein